MSNKELKEIFALFRRIPHLKKLTPYRMHDGTYVALDKHAKIMHSFGTKTKNVIHYLQEMHKNYRKPIISRKLKEVDKACLGKNVMVERDGCWSIKKLKGISLTEKKGSLKFSVYRNNKSIDNAYFKCKRCEDVIYGDEDD